MINYVLYPGLHGTCLFFIWLISKYFKYNTIKSLSGFLFILWVLLVFFTPLAKNLAIKKERTYQTFTISELSSQKNRPMVLVLGAGKVSDPSLDPLKQLSNTVLCRLIEGIRIYQKADSAILITSGSSGRHSLTSQARVVAQAAIELGVSPSDTLELSNTNSTEEEALQYYKRFGTSRSLILVTSAIHMPRAMYLFQQLGVYPIPAPTDFLVKVDPESSKNWWLPSIKKLSMMDDVIHEYVGLYWAQIKRNKK